MKNKNASWLPGDLVVLTGLQWCTLHSEQEIVLSRNDPGCVRVSAGDTMLVIHVGTTKQTLFHSASYIWVLLLHNRTMRCGWYALSNEYPIEKVK